MDPTSRPHRFTDIRRVERTGSTNTDVLELGRSGAGEGVVVVAGEQTAGRGRHDRTWVAPSGSGLLFSVLLRPRARVADLVTASAALAVQDALVARGADGVGIKWPNDLVVPMDRGATGTFGERKLVGILAEADWTIGTTAAGGARGAADDERVLVALGIGINLASGDGFPTEVSDRRVALDELIEAPAAADDVLADVLAGLDAWYGRLNEHRDEVLETWRNRCVTLGRRVRVDLGATDLIGLAVDLDDAGRLVVQPDTGPDRVVAAGDVVHLRDDQG